MIVFKSGKIVFGLLVLQLYVNIFSVGSIVGKINQIVLDDMKRVHDPARNAVVDKHFNPIMFKKLMDRKGASELESTALAGVVNEIIAKFREKRSVISLSYHLAHLNRSVKTHRFKRSLVPYRVFRPVTKSLLRTIATASLSYIMLNLKKSLNLTVFGENINNTENSLDLTIIENLNNFKNNNFILKLEDEAMQNNGVAFLYADIVIREANERQNSERLNRRTLDCSTNNKGCVQNICWTNCGPRITSSNWCFTTTKEPVANLTIEYAKCIFDDDCNSCLPCGSACFSNEGTFSIEKGTSIKNEN